MTPAQDPAPSRRGPPARERELYSYSVLLFRSSPDGDEEPFNVDHVEAPSMLAAYRQAMEDLRARAEDPDDPLHGSQFRFPRTVARRLGERPAPGAARAPAPAPARRAAPAPPPSPPRYPPLRREPASGPPPVRPVPAGDGPYAYDVRVRATDAEGGRHLLLWRDWRASSLLTAYRTVLEGLAAAPEWSGWRFEAQPGGVRSQLAQTRGTDRRPPRPVPEPDEAREDRSAGPPPVGMSDEELASLDETWR